MVQKRGKIIPNGVLLEAHEYKTITTLASVGLNIELIPKSNIPGVHSPDMKIGRTKWEMKSPKGKGRWLLENTLRGALKQSENVIIDLRRIQIPEQKCLHELEKQFCMFKRIKRLKIITKAQQIIDYEK